MAKTPPNITFKGGSASAIDISTTHMNLLLDATQKKAVGLSQVTFTSTGGFLMFLMKPLFAFWMDDALDSGEFLNAYGPSNFEFDHFALRVEVNFVGKRQNQSLFTNGAVSRGRVGQWAVDFPTYFATSSFFLLFTDRSFLVEKFNFQGAQRVIPVMVYGDSASSNAKAKVQLIKSMTELGASFGPYAHKSLTIYLSVPSNPMFSGMEYAGATVSSLGALNHEIGHSWFGRGVMSALGRDGWIDESLMVWRDRGFTSRAFQSSDAGSGVGLVSPYLLGTNQTVYTIPFISGLTNIAGSVDAMNAIVKKMYYEFVYKSINSVEFQSFMQRELKTDLSAPFKKYIYNNTRNSFEPNRYHRNFTKEEIRRML